VHDPGVDLISELEKRNKVLADLLRYRDSVARLMDELPRSLTPHDIATNVSSHETWQLVGRYFMVTGRLYEALAVFWQLYQQMFEAQTHEGKRLHKGMPLVWMADCYSGLGFVVHAKRYLMLTLCEDALREHGRVDPDTTGTYFRLVWGYGLSHSELTRYAKEFHALAESDRQRAFFPEALLQEVDDDWMTEYTSLREASHYRVNPPYLAYLLKELGKSAGQALERTAHYMMSCMPGCRTKRRLRSGSTDYDLVCSIEGADIDYRSELGRYFVCECKDWDEAADYSAFAKFCRVLDSTKARFGILFSKNGISGSGRSAFAEREQLKVFQDRGIVIVVIDEQDLQSVASGANLVNLLRRRYESVRLDIPSRHSQTPST
jgi:hypothetical protein